MAGEGIDDLQFDVIADGGLDRFASLNNDVPVAPFSVHIGPESFAADEMTPNELYTRMRSGGPHPTTSQPSPEEFARLFRTATRPILVVTISQGLSSSFNAADQARSETSLPVHLHDSGTLSGAQAFQVHAALEARRRGLDVATAIEWMKQVHEETELYFTIDTLEYLRKGGRIGQVQATLGSLLGLRPVVTVDKKAGQYTSIRRARSWSKALDAVAAAVNARFGNGTPLRAGLLYGDTQDDVPELQARLSKHHPSVWHGTAPVGPGLAVHTGPKAIGLVAAPGAWPWER